MIDDPILDAGHAVPETAETQRAPLPADPRKKSEQRRRAKRTMIIVTAICVAIGLTPAAEQLVRHGWHAFVDRAPGVGGTPSAPDTAPKPVGEVARSSGTTARALIVPAADPSSSAPTIGPINPLTRTSSTPGIPDWFGLALLPLLALIVVRRIWRVWRN